MFLYLFIMFALPNFFFKTLVGLCRETQKGKSFLSFFVNSSYRNQLRPFISFPSQFFLFWFWWEGMSGFCDGGCWQGCGLIFGKQLGKYS